MDQTRRAYGRHRIIKFIASMWLVTVGLVLAHSAAVSASPLQDAQAQVRALTQSIDQLRLQIQADSLAYQQSETQLQQTQVHITQLHHRIAVKRRQIQTLKLKVRSEALNLFIQGETSPWWFDIAQGNPSSIPLKQEDASTASSIQQQAVLQYQQATAQLKMTLVQLHTLQTQQRDAATAAQRDQSAVELAVTTAQAKLSSASTTVQTLVAQQEQQQAIAAQQAAARQAAAQQAAIQQAAARQAAAQQAAARQAAAQQAAAQQVTDQRTVVTAPPPTSNPVYVNPSPSPPVSSGAYANPLRSISGLAVERIDQGVDYNGVGPIYAIGNGVVTSVYNGGWPSGVYIAYQLTSGPASGEYVYVAESVRPAVSVGESVSSSTVLGTLYNGVDGIETGWANTGGDGTTMAATSGQFYGANSTAYGYNFSQLLQSLGAPGGILTGPPTGLTSSNWPQWS